MRTQGRECVRGCERRIYYVKNTGSELFEEAYLVLRRKESGVRPGRTQFDISEMEREAARIVEAASGESMSHAATRGRDRLKMFFAGAATSAALAALVTLCTCVISGA